MELTTSFNRLSFTLNTPRFYNQHFRAFLLSISVDFQYCFKRVCHSFENSLQCVEYKIFNIASGFYNSSCIFHRKLGKQQQDTWGVHRIFAPPLNRFLSRRPLLYRTRVLKSNNEIISNTIGHINRLNIKNSRDLYLSFSEQNIFNNAKNVYKKRWVWRKIKASNKFKSNEFVRYMVV